MRILLLIDALGSGGAERQMTYLAISLKKAGCEIRLIGIGTSGYKSRNTCRRNGALETPLGDSKVGTFLAAGCCDSL